MSTINAVNTRLVTVAASHVHCLAHGCLLPAQEAGSARLFRAHSQASSSTSGAGLTGASLQSSTRHCQCVLSHKMLWKGEKELGQKCEGEKIKKWERRALSCGSHPVAPRFIACLSKTQHHGAPNRASRTSLTSSCFSCLSVQLDISASSTNL